VKCIKWLPLKKLVKLCRILNDEILYAEVKIGEHLSSKFKVNKGLRQGCAIAPVLFNIVLEIAIRRSKVETREPYLTNLVILWRMLMIILLEEDYKILKYLHHWLNKQYGIRNK
jgi:hypothetical protein